MGAQFDKDVNSWVNRLTARGYRVAPLIRDVQPGVHRLRIAPWAFVDLWYLHLKDQALLCARVGMLVYGQEAYFCWRQPYQLRLFLYDVADAMARRAVEEIEMRRQQFGRIRID